MLDSKLLRGQTEFVASELARRGFEFDAKQYHELEDQRKLLQIETQELQNERNVRSKSIGQAKARGESIDDLRKEVGELGDKLSEKKVELNDVLAALETIHLSLPNILHESVPDGMEESDACEERRWGEVRSFDFTAKSHDELGEELGLMDFAAAAKIAGARFVVMRKGLVRLHRALTQFMLDTHINEHGYEELYVPYIVNADSLLATGQLPKFDDDLFKLNHEHDFYLTSTGEVPLTNMVRGEMLNASDLPIQYVSHTPCFRSEAGSYGKDTKGMIRQHQFEKVELVWIVHPEKSYQVLEQLVSHAEAILKRLELPYRVMTLAAGDTGGGSAKTYDIEVWLPSQNTYREISSCSNFEAYQARRLKTRFKDQETNETRLVHTLNGSGLAVGRTLVAVMENYQDKQGRIHIPNVLKPYMPGIEVIG